MVREADEGTTTLVRKTDDGIEVNGDSDEQGREIDEGMGDER